ncbi:MAG: diaminopimelate epimerase [Oscillospiraceae bacterium]|nr:diaminopimelate epimerase [Oscillospiraceae bacterium]
MHFTKMHGTCNDYICLNCTNFELRSPGKIAARLSRRHTGIGADGLIQICQSDCADFKMKMYNADGSEGKMCGNGLRCVGKFIYDKRLSSKRTLTIETRAGIKRLSLQLENNSVRSVTVEMGKADFTAASLPVNYKNLEKIIDESFYLGGKEYFINCLSVGNPHCVIFSGRSALGSIETLDLGKLGPLFENNEIFPERVNTEFAEVPRRNVLKMRVWERGSGETMACGTGACACAAAAVENGLCGMEEKITVILPGGNLTVIYASDGSILMEGETETVFEGGVEI